MPPDAGGTVERHTAFAGRSATRHSLPAEPRFEAVEGTLRRPAVVADGSGGDAPFRDERVASGAPPRTRARGHAPPSRAFRRRPTSQQERERRRRLAATTSHVYVLQ